MHIFFTPTSTWLHLWRAQLKIFFNCGQYKSIRILQDINVNTLHHSCTNPWLTCHNVNALHYTCRNFWLTYTHPRNYIYFVSNYGHTFLANLFLLLHSLSEIKVTMQEHTREMSVMGQLSHSGYDTALWLQSVYENDF